MWKTRQTRTGIPTKIVNEFLNRRLRDYRKYKRFTDEELDARHDRLPKAIPLWGKLRRRQRICALIGAKTKRFAYHMDTGTGKTFLSIALARYFIRTKQAKRLLVLVPNIANKGEWQDEIAKHSPKTSSVVLSGSSKQKWDQLLDTDCSLVIETYSGLVRMMCDKKDRSLKPSRSKVQALSNEIDGLVLDESTAVKNSSGKMHGSLSFRICRALSKRVNIVFALSGTPFGRSPIDLWAQMFIVDHGETLGKTLGLFRAAFFREENDGWTTKYVFQSDKRQLLNDVLANRSIRIPADPRELPKVNRIIKTVNLPSDVNTYIDKAWEAIFAAKGKPTESKNAFLRLRQISSGFLGYRDDETGERAKFVFPENPKLDILTSLVRFLSPSEKFIIFHEFNHSGQVICDMLDKLGIKYSYIGGLKSSRGGSDAKRRFVEDRNCPGLVLSSAAGAFGLNVQVAKYGFVYESPVPAIIRRQMERRLERQESAHKIVFLYDLVCRNTMDEHILNFHASGKDLFRAIIDGRIRR